MGMPWNEEPHPCKFELFKSSVPTISWCTNGVHGNQPAGTPCANEWSYKGKIHKDHQCEGTRYGGYGWCSTTAGDYNRDRAWGGCTKCSQVNSNEFRPVASNKKCRESHRLGAVLHGSATKEVCAAHCQGTSGCIAFTYNPSWSGKAWCVACGTYDILEDHSG